uniref:immune-related, lectin-like receptor 4 n=1 Tax=Centroberyx gerrardi TaxID=166262 RepID=UPI003AB09ACE
MGLWTTLILASQLILKLCLDVEAQALDNDNVQTKKSFQALTAEHAAVRKNLTDRISHIRSCSKVQTTPSSCKPPSEDGTCSKCEEDWEPHRGMCYHFYNKKLTWNESRQNCKKKGGDLVKIDSEDEQRFLELTLRKKMATDEDKFWIGLTDSKKESDWLWVDDTRLEMSSLSFWSGTEETNEPDNWTDNGNNPEGEDCVRMGEKGGAKNLKCWFDKSCEVPHKSICEKQAQIGRVSCV